jgi:DNA polymerase-3 subunit alpha
VAKENFIHLHVHSEYSLLDGAARIRDLVEEAERMGMDALALTDHGVMYGVIDFYEACEKKGIKPIIGCELYVAPRSRFEKTKKDESPHHLLVLAQDNEGYQNLLEIVTRSYFEGYYYKPRVDKELLSEYSKGLIGFSACLAGEVPRLILSDKFDEAKEVAQVYKDIFGEGNFYFELMDHGLPEQKKVLKEIVNLSKKLSIPLVATNDVHYIYPEDRNAHEVLLCIQTNATLDDEDRLTFKSGDFYLKSSQEMYERFKEFPEAIKNTLALAERVNIKFDFGKINLPKYKVPEGYDLNSYLRKLCLEGLKERFGESVPQEAEERLEKELKVIEEMGFAGYFLIIWDVIKFARENGIRVGPGRGSAAGSLVSYVLGITNINPLEYGLLFERFLNPERKTLPDIDIDICEDRRDEVLRYVKERYGEDRVAQIITFSTLKARAATRDAGRVLGFSYGQVDKIAKLITRDSVEASLAEVKELKEVYEKDAEAKRILDTAKRLEGLARQDSIHAAGVVISQERLTKYVPLQKKGEAEVVTQFSMGPLGKLGLLKMDFLGLRTLTVIEETLNLIQKNRGIKLDIDSIPLDDKKTYELIAKGETVGVFQLEKPGMRALLKELKPTQFEDIIAANALNRPGPLKSGMVQDFIERKHGRKKVSYPHPALESILKETYGTIVYQEQVMGIASALAGYSLAEADILRKAISKKEKGVWEKEKKKFVKKAVENGVSEEEASRIFDMVAPFVEYAFNKSHSAAYAYLAYQTAYLKAHYPLEFLTALLTSVKDDQDKVALYINEARKRGIKVLLPDVNSGEKDFTVENGCIRFGLSAIRNVGESVVERIIEGRKKGPFKSIGDFCERVDMSVLNKRAFESLIKAGAFDSLGYKRKYLLENYEKFSTQAQRKQKEMRNGQFALFEVKIGEELEEKGKEEFEGNKLLSMEKEMLGVYVSDHPLLSVKEVVEGVITHSSSELEEVKEGQEVCVGGIISHLRRSFTKKGETMVTLTLDDLEGSIQVIVFPKVLSENQEKIDYDKIVAVSGRIDISEERQEIKVIARRIYTLDEIEKGMVEKPKSKLKVTGLHLKIEAGKLTPELQNELKRIIPRYGGNVPVYVHLFENGKRKSFKLSENYSVDLASPLIAELKYLLGEKNVIITKG